MIFGPDGKPLCEPLGDGEEGILKADVDLRDIDYPKAFIDVVGHCKKPCKSGRHFVVECPRRNQSLVSYARFDLFGKLLTFWRCRCSARFVEPTGEPDDGHARNKDAEIMRVLIPVYHEDCVGNTEMLGWREIGYGVVLNLIVI